MVQPITEHHKVIRPTMKGEDTSGGKLTTIVMQQTGFNGDPDGPPPREDITVVTPTKWKDGNVYKVGQTVYFTPAVFTGGEPEQTVTRWRLQKRSDPNDSWANYSWTNYDGTASECNITCPAGQMRIHCQARDSSVDPAQQVNSMAPVQTVESKSIGELTVTVDDVPYDHTSGDALSVQVNNPMRVVVAHAGDADPTATWAARDNYPLMVSQQSDHVVLTLPQAGFCAATCTLTDSNASDSPQVAMINFLVA